jgi:hypothetical protein
VPLLSVHQIIQGQTTAVFRRDPLPEFESVSFSLLYSEGKGSAKERSLDLVCRTTQEFETWWVDMIKLAGVMWGCWWPRTLWEQYRSTHSQHDAAHSSGARLGYSVHASDQYAASLLWVASVASDTNQVCGHMCKSSHSMWRVA